MQSSNILNFLDSYVQPVFFLFANWLINVIEYVESNHYLYALWLFFCFANVIVTVWYFLCTFTELTGNSIFYGNLYKSVRDSREAKADEKYRLRKEENRAEAEERYQKRLAEAEERRQEKASIREKELMFRQIPIGNQTVSDEMLATGYFYKHPNATKITIGGKTYWNLNGLQSAYSEFEEEEMTGLTREEQIKWFQYQRRQQNNSDDNL